MSRRRKGGIGPTSRASCKHVDEYLQHYSDHIIRQLRLVPPYRDYNGQGNMASGAPFLCLCCASIYIHPPAADHITSSQSPLLLHYKTTTATGAQQIMDGSDKNRVTGIPNGDVDISPSVSTSLHLGNEQHLPSQMASESIQPNSDPMAQHTTKYDNGGGNIYEIQHGEGGIAPGLALCLTTYELYCLTCMEYSFQSMALLSSTILRSFRQWRYLGSYLRLSEIYYPQISFYSDPGRGTSPLQRPNPQLLQHTQDSQQHPDDGLQSNPSVSHNDNDNDNYNDNDNNSSAGPCDYLPSPSSGAGGGIPTTLDFFGLRGLTNLGSTCYLNSIIQCFTAIPCLVDAILGCHFELPLHDGIAASIGGDQPMTSSESHLYSHPPSNSMNNDDHHHVESELSGLSRIKRSRYNHPTTPTENLEVNPSGTDVVHGSQPVNEQDIIAGSCSYYIPPVHMIEHCAVYRLYQEKASQLGKTPGTNYLPPRRFEQALTSSFSILGTSSTDQNTNYEMNDAATPLTNEGSRPTIAWTDPDIVPPTVPGPATLLPSLDVSSSPHRHPHQSLVNNHATTRLSGLADCITSHPTIAHSISYSTRGGTDRHRMNNSLDYKNRAAQSGSACHDHLMDTIPINTNAALLDPDYAHDLQYPMHGCMMCALTHTMVSMYQNSYHIYDNHYPRQDIAQLPHASSSSPPSLSHHKAMDVGTSTPPAIVSHLQQHAVHVSQPTLPSTPFIHNASKTTAPLSLTHLMYALWRSCPIFASSSQHDSHEAFTCLIDVACEHEHAYVSNRRHITENYAHAYTQTQGQLFRATSVLVKTGPPVSLLPTDGSMGGGATAPAVIGQPHTVSINPPSSELETKPKVNDNIEDEHLSSCSITPCCTLHDIFRVRILSRRTCLSCSHKTSVVETNLGISVNLQQELLYQHDLLNKRNTTVDTRDTNTQQEPQESPPCSNSNPPQHGDGIIPQGSQDGDIDDDLPALSQPFQQRGSANGHVVPSQEESNSQGKQESVLPPPTSKPLRRTSSKIQSIALSECLKSMLNWTSLPLKCSKCTAPLQSTSEPTKTVEELPVTTAGYMDTDQQAVAPQSTPSQPLSSDLENTSPSIQDNISAPTPQQVNPISSSPPPPPPQSVMQQHMLDSLPPTLVFHLYRFGNVDVKQTTQQKKLMTTFNNSINNPVMNKIPHKITTHVQFPQVLDITELCSPRLRQAHQEECTALFNIFRTSNDAGIGPFTCRTTPTEIDRPEGGRKPDEIDIRLFQALLKQMTLFCAKSLFNPIPYPTHLAPLFSKGSNDLRMTSSMSDNASKTVKTFDQDVLQIITPQLQSQDPLTEPQPAHALDSNLVSQRARHHSTKHQLHIHSPGTENGSDNGHDHNCYPIRYVLQGVVVHKGKLTSGHYFSYIYRYGIWFRCDDHSILPVSIEEVLATEAYILFYGRAPYLR